MKSGWFRALLPSLFLGAVGVLAVASPAAALGTRIYTVPLSGSQEVPPVVTGGTGVCTVTLDDVTGAVSVSGSFSGLTSNATLAHIHGLAAAGVNAGILVTLTETGGTSGSVSGSGTLSATNLAGMLSGLTYINIHTTNNPGGELRGQITQEVPALPWQWMSVLALVALAGGAFVLTRRGPLPSAA